MASKIGGLKEKSGSILAFASSSSSSSSTGGSNSSATFAAAREAAAAQALSESLSDSVRERAIVAAGMPVAFVVVNDQAFAIYIMFIYIFNYLS